MKARMAVIAAAYKLAWAASPGGVTTQAILNALNRLLPGPLLAVSLDRTVESVTAGSSPGVIWVVFLVVAAAAPVALDYVWETTQFEVFEKHRHASQSALLAALMAPVSLAHLEDPENADALATAKAHPQSAGVLVDWLNAFLVGIPSLGLTLLLLWKIETWLVFIALSALAFAPLHGRVRKASIRFIDKTLPGQRLAQRLFSLGTDRRAAQEIRLFGCGPWLSDRHRQELDGVADAMRRAERRPQISSLVASIAHASLLTLGLVLLMQSAVRSDVSAGQVAAGVVLLAQSLDHMFNLSSAASDVTRHVHATEKLARVLQLGTTQGSSSDALVPEGLTTGLSVDRVSFSYPWTERQVLTDISLELPAGSVVALVGENGAGKSTLVHLLLRFYDPDAGQISVDGVDLRRFAAADWRRATTAGFQDFARYHFLVREGIGVGDVPNIENTAAVSRAAAEAGAASFLSALPRGYETQLGPYLDDGVDLSEGQWQRVALARTAMRERPLLTVLDEPTSALDPLAEEEVFRHYTARTAANRTAGGVTLLISHRFSTVALADVIVVLHEGQVVDVGSHAELMERGGLYAELYGMQASRYR